ncbi:hypothetical protein ACMTN4_00175 (plasmid) [Rhodococcus globerulus]|uniref:hypothetical protein n=1 Tax=Rhodococcus globerulus TaxID=33008 RepID=UPI0039ED9C22
MPPYKGHRRPVEIINRCVWLYFRFPLSFSEVLDVLIQSRRNTLVANGSCASRSPDMVHVPPVIIADKLASRQVTHHEMPASVEHR